MTLSLSSLLLIFGGNFHWDLRDPIFGSLLHRMPLSPWCLLFIFEPSPKTFDVVEVREVVDVGKVIVDDHDASSSFQSQAPDKAFVSGWIAYPMRSLLAPLGWRLWEVLLCAWIKHHRSGYVTDVVVEIPQLQLMMKGEVKDTNGNPSVPICWRRQSWRCRLRFPHIKKLVKTKLMMSKVVAKPLAKMPAKAVCWLSTRWWNPIYAGMLAKS
jgi:hypothetical protein